MNTADPEKEDSNLAGWCKHPLLRDARARLLPEVGLTAAQVEAIPRMAVQLAKAGQSQETAAEWKEQLDAGTKYPLLRILRQDSSHISRLELLDWVITRLPCSVDGRAATMCLW